jgi:hypothetical protein
MISYDIELVGKRRFDQQDILGFNQDVRLRVHNCQIRSKQHFLPGTLRPLRLMTACSWFHLGRCDWRALADACRSVRRSIESGKTVRGKAPRRHGLERCAVSARQPVMRRGERALRPGGETMGVTLPAALTAYTGKATVRRRASGRRQSAGWRWQAHRCRTGDRARAAPAAPPRCGGPGLRDRLHALMLPILRPYCLSEPQRGRRHPRCTCRDGLGRPQMQTRTRAIGRPA